MSYFKFLNKTFYIMNIFILFSSNKMIERKPFFAMKCIEIDMHRSPEFQRFGIISAKHKSKNKAI